MDDIVSLSSNININAVTSAPSSPSLGEDRDRKLFTQEIHKFMSENGKPLSKIPIMGYKELDLYQLFKEVVANGGFNEVVKNVGTWSKIWKRLGNFDPSITDSSFRLKKNYERYLLEYEFKCYPEHKAQALEFQEKSSFMKRSNSTNNIDGSSSYIQRPHSPTSLSNSSSSTGLYSLTTNSNPSLANLHNSPESQSLNILRKKGKKKLRKSSSTNSFNSSSRTPSRSSSFNNINLLSLQNVKFPLILEDGLTIESLGTIIPKYPYVVENQIYPVGFTSYRDFTSRVNPDRQVRYVSQILDNGERPQFVVTAMDDLEHPVYSTESPSSCWRIILQHFIDTPINTDLNEHNTTTSTSNQNKLSVSGRYRFGLTQSEVSTLLKELPNAEKALDLFVPMSPSKRKFTSDDIFDDSKKVQRHTRNSSVAREDMDDLESAIATLQALKYCSVF